MGTTKTLVAWIAAEAERAERCEKEGRDEGRLWALESLDTLEKLLPSGSGIDCGTKIDREKTTREKVVLIAEFHHMNENGFYAGWTLHTITIRPTFDGFDLKIGGRDRNGIKEYLADVYQTALSARYEWTLAGFEAREE